MTKRPWQTYDEFLKGACEGPISFHVLVNAAIALRIRSGRFEHFREMTRSFGVRSDFEGIVKFVWGGNLQPKVLQDLES